MDEAKYWWLSYAVFLQGHKDYHYRNRVTKVHPFQLMKSVNDATSDDGTHTVFELVAWRPISEKEYQLFKYLNPKMQDPRSFLEFVR